MLVQIGDGALVAGVGSWLRAASPGTRVIGVAARNSPAMAESVAAGRPIERPAHTIADGLAITRPIAEALELVRAAVDEILAVGEEALIAAMRLLIEKAGLLSEPSGAAGVAALLEHGARFRGAAVAVIVTGSNLDPKLLPRLTE
jgi:threonine dehydratase